MSPEGRGSLPRSGSRRPTGHERSSGRGDSAPSGPGEPGLVVSGGLAVAGRGAGMATSTRKTATDESTRFFEQLAVRGEEPTLRNFSGRVQFDVVDGARTDSWLVAIDRGHLTVTPDKGAADCTVRADRAAFDQV